MGSRTRKVPDDGAPPRRTTVTAAEPADSGGLGLWTAGVVAVAYLAAFGPTLAGLAAEWVRSYEQIHGAVIAPIALYLAWQRRTFPPRAPDRAAGLVVLVSAVGLYVAGVMAAERFTPRLAALLALAGLTLYFAGRRQLRAWAVPLGLLLFVIPLPEVVLSTVTLPLQLLSSEAAVRLLELRHVPVALSGNVIQLPGTELLVSEACSGLRSLWALVAVTLLVGGTALRNLSLLWVVLPLAVPAAVVANVGRVFLTGFLGYYAGPEAVRGMAHEAVGLATFVAALLAMLAVIVLVRRWEGGDA